MFLSLDLIPKEMLLKDLEQMEWQEKVCETLELITVFCIIIFSKIIFHNTRDLLNFMTNSCKKTYNSRTYFTTVFKIGSFSTINR